MKLVKTAAYGLMTKDHLRLLGEVFDSRADAEDRARQLGQNYKVVLVDVIR